MSFEIKMQTNKSENICLSKNITDILTVNGTIKAETSLVNPVLIVECDINQIIDCNYLTIETFGRKYFVTDITSIRTGLCQITAKCDVLSSFESQIRSNSGILKRQEGEYNLYVNDGLFKTYQNPIVSTVPFPQGFTDKSYILAVAGG